VISRLSILDHPLVKDVLAYLHLIDSPADDIACARVLAAPAWSLEPGDLVRLAERARKERKALYEMLQGPQGQLAFDASHAALSKLIEFVSEQRKTLHRRSARGILADLLEWLEVAQRASPQDRKYVKRLSEFAKEWEPKSETQSLAEFVEYLDYYGQAGGTISLEDDVPGDAVQLMTVHGAKGLEFPQVFLLRVNNKKFPAAERSRVFEFPAALMKEGEPAEQFHIQEERRLFYVAVTRAENRLTLTTLTEKKGKIPVFIEDLLMDPAIKRRDIYQMKPKLPETVSITKKQSPYAGDPLLFPLSEPAKIFSRIADWALEFHPLTPEPLTLSPSAVSGYRTCPQQYLFSRSWRLREGPKAVLSFGSVMHTTIKRFVDQLRKGVKLPFDDVARILDTEWTSAGFEDDYQEQGYKQEGLEQLRVFYTSILATPSQVLELEKSFELPLANNVTITGRMDQVNSLGGKDVEIIDYKTGKPKKDADAKRDLQLSLYALAAKEIFEWNPVRLVFHYLQNNQIQVTTRDAKQLEEAQAIVLEAADDIRAGQFPPNPGFVCRSCAYKPICPAHEEALSG
jgi:DNA helicase-2/ATP-dependent DNA helicase PcrA